MIGGATVVALEHDGVKDPTKKGSGAEGEDNDKGKKSKKGEEENDEEENVKSSITPIEDGAPLKEKLIHPADKLPGDQSPVKY
mgnify:CR=1 FL=1